MIPILRYPSKNCWMMLNCAIIFIVSNYIELMSFWSSSLLLTAWGVAAECIRKREWATNKEENWPVRWSRKENEKKISIMSAILSRENNWNYEEEMKMPKKLAAREITRTSWFSLARAVTITSCSPINETSFHSLIISYN